MVPQRTSTRPSAPVDHVDGAPHRPRDHLVMKRYMGHLGVMKLERLGNQAVALLLIDLDLDLVDLRIELGVGETGRG